MTAREQATRVIRQQTLISDLATAKDVVRRLDNAGLLTLATGHPTTLATAEDYENAPTGTIAAINGFDPITKSKDGWKDDELGIMSDSEVAELAVAPREVLRWGKNK